VTAVDTTEDYCETARWLNRLVGLHDQVSVRQADVTDLPYDDATFDVVLSQHVQMNVADKTRLYQETRRVLCTGGQLAIWDLTDGARGELDYPKPGVVAVSGLRGAPIAEHFLSFSPAGAMNLRPDCAIQIVLAGKDELFDIRSSIAAYEAFRGTNKNLVILPDATHYDAYTREREQVQGLAIAWFDRHLKP